MRRMQPQGRNGIFAPGRDDNYSIQAFESSPFPGFNQFGQPDMLAQPDPFAATNIYGIPNPSYVPPYEPSNIPSYSPSYDPGS